MGKPSLLEGVAWIGFPVLSAYSGYKDTGDTVEGAIYRLSDDYLGYNVPAGDFALRRMKEGALPTVATQVIAGLGRKYKLNKYISPSWLPFKVF